MYTGDTGQLHKLHAKYFLCNYSVHAIISTILLFNYPNCVLNLYAINQFYAINQYRLYYLTLSSLINDLQRWHWPQIM